MKTKSTKTLLQNYITGNKEPDNYRELEAELKSRGIDPEKVFDDVISKIDDIARKADAKKNNKTKRIIERKKV